MDDYTADEVREALAPIASLLSKSEKARLKLAPGSWQHTMLSDNIKALRIASALLGEPVGELHEPSRDDLEAAFCAFDSMIERVANTRTQFPEGTSQHSLQRNRLKALRIARTAVVGKLDGR
jgi:hypothetical protein